MKKVGFKLNFIFSIISLIFFLFLPEIVNLASVFEIIMNVTDMEAIGLNVTRYLFLLYGVHHFYIGLKGYFESEEIKNNTVNK